MRSGSTRSQQALLASLDKALEAGADAAAIAGEVFQLVDLLEREPSLRRALTEPTLSGDARRGIARALLQGKVSEPTVAIVGAGAAERWSRSRDLAEALERCAVLAEATRADQAGELDTVEDDLFRFGRILESSPQLRDALSDRAVSVAARRRLLRDVLGSRVGPVTVDLLSELVAGRQRSLAAGLERYSEILAARRQRLVATAWVAAALTEEQKGRIAGLLADHYAHEVHLNVIVDPAVLGGVRVAVADDVIDSSIQTRLAQAQRQLIR